MKYSEIQNGITMLYCAQSGDTMKDKNLSKVICSCHGVTKGDMITAIESGVTKYKEFREQSNLGKDCSSCRSKNKERFQKYKRKLGV